VAKPGPAAHRAPRPSKSWAVLLTKQHKGEAQHIRRRTIACLRSRQACAYLPVPNQHRAWTVAGHRPSVNPSGCPKRTVGLGRGRGSLLRSRY
jgi:hypothetical protein